MKETEILERANKILDNLTFVREGVDVSIGDLGTLELIAYGKLAGAVLFYHKDSPYMITFIENYSNELDEAIQKIANSKLKKKEESN